MADEIKKDFRQELTDKFVAALEEGRIPWQRPWNETAIPLSAPINAISEKSYQGGNRLVLTLTQMDKNYLDPRWVTFNQAKTLGGSVAKGEKGTQIEFWREKPFFERKDVDVKLGGSPVKVMSEKDDQVTLAGGRTAPVSAFTVHHDGKEYGWGQAERKLNTLVGQTHTLFNVGQCQDLKIEPMTPTPESKMPMHERGELLLEGMKNDGVRFVESPNRAFYRSASDTISLPPRDDFKSEAMFYGTALHESAHATGNEKRLNRDVGKHEFGSEGYAKEELVAEMTSAFLATETGIPHDMEDHKAYIQSWASALKNDKNEIFRAAKLADQAANYMHDRAREAQLEKTNEMSNELEKFAGIETEPLPGLSPEAGLREIWSAKGVSAVKQDELLQEIAAKAAPGASVGPFKIGGEISKPLGLPGNRYDLSHIFSALPAKNESAVLDIDAQLAQDHAAMDAGTMERIFDDVMSKTDKQLAIGKIDQQTFDRLTEKYAKPDLPGMNGLSAHDVLMGDYKPYSGSRVYVERGFLTIDHEDRKISFGGAQSLGEAASEYGLSTKDLRTANAIELKQIDAKNQELSKQASARRAANKNYHPTIAELKAIDAVLIEQYKEKLNSENSEQNKEAHAQPRDAAIRHEAEPEIDLVR